jgi:uncharacterized protein YbjT (DUF2867 family)
VTRKVLIAGASGLVGSRILRLLLADASVGAVHAVCRRALAIAHPKLTLHVVDFRKLPALPSVDEVHLALGTTIRVAGSQPAFRAVDLDANLAVAKAGVAAGARRIALVSAIGANASSSIFYNRVKGELEEALVRLPLEALVIARPSLLLGDRDALEQPARVSEKLAGRLLPLVEPLLPSRYRPVGADAVATALLATLPTARGTRTLTYREITGLAERAGNTDQGARGN